MMNESMIETILPIQYPSVIYTFMAETKRLLPDTQIDITRGFDKANKVIWSIKLKSQYGSTRLSWSTVAEKFSFSDDEDSTSDPYIAAWRSCGSMVMTIPPMYLTIIIISIIGMMFGGLFVGLYFGPWYGVATLIGFGFLSMFNLRKSFNVSKNNFEKTLGRFK